jgi:hypothetical protein
LLHRIFRGIEHVFVGEARPRIAMLRTIAAMFVLLLVGSHLTAQDVSQRADRWREDIRFLARELPAKHKNAFAHVDRESFMRAAATLDSAVPHLSDTQIQLGIARIAALLHDGHTNSPTPIYTFRLPLAILWLDDGPYVVDASAEYRTLIGGRIARINGHDAGEVGDSLRLYISWENELGFRARAGSLFIRPAALRDIGIGEDTVDATLVVVQGGASSTVRVNGVRAAGLVLPTTDSLPLYRQRTGEKYWWTYVPNERTLFIKYSQCRDPDDFRHLADSVASVIDQDRPARVVVDLRDNSGGNSEVVQPLLDVLRKRGDVNRPDALFVIIGRVTFSSGLMAAVDFRRRTHATILGEPTGERPNNYGEVRSLRLPNSGLQVTYSTKFFRLVAGDPDSFAPDVHIPPTAEAYAAKRDPAMEWILAHSRPVSPY